MLPESVFEGEHFLWGVTGAAGYCPKTHPSELRYFFMDNLSWKKQDKPQQNAVNKLQKLVYCCFVTKFLKIDKNSEYMSEKNNLIAMIQLKA